MRTAEPILGEQKKRPNKVGCFWLGFLIMTQSKVWVQEIEPLNPSRRKVGAQDIEPCSEAVWIGAQFPEPL